MAELQFIDGEWKNIPTPMSIVRCLPDSAIELKKQNHRISYALGSRFVFLGEIANMKGYCMVVSLSDNRTYGPLESTFFEEYNE